MLLQSMKNKRSNLLSKEEKENLLTKRRKPPQKPEIVPTVVKRRSLGRSVGSKNIQPNIANLKEKTHHTRDKIVTENKFEKKVPLTKSHSRIKSNCSINKLDCNGTSSQENIFVPKKKTLKTSEELILEQMSKFKFKAKPWKKEVSKTTQSEEKEVQDVKMIDTSTSDNNKTIQESNESQEMPVEFPLGNKELLSKSLFIRQEKKADPKTSRSFSRDQTDSPTNHKENSRSLLKDFFSKSREEKYVFKARPMPEFNVKEVKRSTSNLTIPNPPKLSCGKKLLSDKKQ
jgi:hypothetical protein